VRLRDLLSWERRNQGGKGRRGEACTFAEKPKIKNLSALMRSGEEAKVDRPPAWGHLRETVSAGTNCSWKIKTWGKIKNRK